MSYFYSLIRLCTAGLCLKSTYHLISRGTSRQRQDYILRPAHGEVCRDKTVSGTCETRLHQRGRRLTLSGLEMIDSQNASLFEHRISYAHKHGHIKREGNVTGGPVSDS